MRRLPVLCFLVAAACGDPVERAPQPEVSADAAGGTAAATALAITIDDLPWVGPLPPGTSRAEGTRRILDALAAHNAQATGFVNCGRVSAGAPILRMWQDGGHELGNHTSEHLDLNQAEPSVWVDDAAECDARLRDLTGEQSLTFRYPYLHRGHTVTRYNAGREALSALGSEIAPVSINTADWVIDDAYVAALAVGDEEHAAAIAEAYVDHISRAAAHYREVAEERTGGDVAHILLLHANALLADRLEAVLDRLSGEGYRFVTLEAALRDSVYALPDDYIGPEGLSWLYRIPPAIPSAHAWDLEEAARLRELTR